MKEKKGFEPEKSGCFVVLVFFSFCFLILYFIKEAEEKKRLLEEKGVYFVAEVVDIIDKYDEDNEIVVKYEFNNEVIIRRIQENCCPEIGKLYYIKILPNSPKGVMILFSGAEVPDYIQTNISKEGWKEPPSYIKDAHSYEVSD